MNFSHLYDNYQDRINKNLSKILKVLPTENSNLLKAIKYAVLLGGKRLRACIVYVIGDMFKVNFSTLDIIASAIELIHSYSLVHDDLPCIDNDLLRRGHSSCHVKYGEDISLLAGDALQSLAFNVLSNYTMPNVSNKMRLKMISELSHAIGASGMCLGQALDLESKKKTFNLSKLKKINLYKTAFLIRSSARLSFLASHFFSKKILSILDRLFIAVGLSFQIQDDIFDLKNDIKKVENNVNVKKNTYPSVIGLKQSYKKIKKLHKEIFCILQFLKHRSFNTSILELLIQFIIKRSQ